MSDQQFCLRWNNHQSTLVSVFDTLLENNVLVDCTLAAEGQFLKAHKVVLCACSPYLELLLSQHYEKHPILILKDVKFQELKSMMDYMYKGEVNISQDQLGTFLKAAESLQIKGLTDGTGDDSRDVGSTQPKRHEPPRKATHNQQPRSPAVLPHASSGLTIEPRRSTHDVPDSPIRSREGSTSPTPRKRRRPRRPSQGEDYETSYDNGDSQNTAIVPSTNQVTSTPNAIPKIQPPDTDENDELNRIAEAGLIKEKTEPPSEFVEPKMEAEEPPVDDNVEDLTLDDDDELDGMDMGAGPSHSNDNSNQGYGWGLSDRNDDMYLSQDGIAQRDNQDSSNAKVVEHFGDGGKSPDVAEEVKTVSSGGYSVASSSSSAPTCGASIKKTGISGVLSIKSSDGKVLTLSQLRDVYCGNEQNNSTEFNATGLAKKAASLISSGFPNLPHHNVRPRCLRPKTLRPKLMRPPPPAISRAAPRNVRFPSHIASSQPAPPPPPYQLQALESGSRIKRQFSSDLPVVTTTTTTTTNTTANTITTTTTTTTASLAHFSAYRSGGGNFNKTACRTANPTKSTIIPTITTDTLKQTYKKTKSALPADDPEPTAVISQLRGISLTPVITSKSVDASSSTQSSLSVTQQRVATSEISTTVVSSSIDGNSFLKTTDELSFPRNTIDSGVLSLTPALTKTISTATVENFPITTSDTINALITSAVVSNYEMTSSRSFCSTVQTFSRIQSEIDSTIDNKGFNNTRLTDVSANFGFSESQTVPITGSCSSVGNFTLTNIANAAATSSGSNSTVTSNTSTSTVRPHPCRNNCGQYFTNVESWRDHCRFRCERRYRYSCDACDEKYITKRRFLKHMRTVHGQDEEQNFSGGDTAASP